MKRTITDEKNQILTINICIYLYWNDPRLMWNPDNYSNVDLIKVQANKIWLPDFSIVNAAGTSNLFDAKQVERTPQFEYYF
jgi:hypothetical protein